MPSRTTIGGSEVRLEYLRALQRAFQEGRLSLFLGAGISLPYSLPNWQDLVVALLLNETGHAYDRFYPHYRTALANWLAENFEFSPTTLARVVKYRLRKLQRSGRQFHKLVRDRLYSNYRPPQVDPTLLDEVAQLIKHAQNGSGGIYRIVNFNFDSLLEERLKSLGVPTAPIYSDIRRMRNTTEIIHPHGFLPKNDDIPRQELVFTEDEYHEITLQPFNWAATEIASTLRNSVVFCIGLSMTDPNLRRTLDACKGGSSKVRHYVLRRDYDVHNINLDEAVEKIQDRAEKERQRRSASQVKSPGGVRQAISHILKQAHTYDRQLFKDLGVGALWVRDFNDMPGVVRTVYEGC